MKLWGGRFTKSTDKIAEDFQSSIKFDQRLYREDITGSIAHAAMLGKCDIIRNSESQQIITGLQSVLADIEDGKAQFDTAAEDIHMNIEKLLTEKIGQLGKKLHTARSRNDQVALDLRLALRGEIAAVQELLMALSTVLLDLADQHKLTVMPGYTHLQKAQPLTFAHHLLAYQQMFSRDLERFDDCDKRTAISPLGSCALAGTGFPIDREDTAAALGFSAPCANSLDGVSDRDFVLEFLADAAILMMHLSRFCEEIILWSSNEFSFITLDDAYSTGSSIMPQKKNPDMAELIRGKTGRVYGDLLTLLTVMKGLPLAYNKDMQEDKEAFFDAADTVKNCLTVMAPMLATMKVNQEKMLKGVEGGFINATDVADYLAAKGLPFREAHAVSGHLVLLCEQQGINLSQLALEKYRQESELFESDIYDFISPLHCVAARNVYGGPAPETTAQVINVERSKLAKRKNK